MKSLMGGVDRWSVVLDGLWSRGYRPYQDSPGEMEDIVVLKWVREYERVGLGQMGSERSFYGGQGQGSFKLAGII